MERKLAFDVMKGISIILVIIGHLQIPNILHHIIYSFHMPLFVIIGGYFFKSKSIKSFNVLKDIKRLGLPYLFTISVLFLYTCIVFFVSEGGNIAGLCISILYPDGIFENSILPIWFLMALLWSRLLAKILWYDNNNILFRWVAVIAISWAAYLYQPIDFLPLCLTKGCVYIVFFSIGYCASKSSFMASKQILYISIACWAMYLLTLNLNIFQLYRGILFPLYVFGASGATLIFYKVSLMIESHLPNITRSLCWFGRYSMVILCVHTIDRYIPMLHIMHLDQNVFILFVSRLLVCVIGVLIVRRSKYLSVIFQIK